MPPRLCVVVVAARGRRCTVRSRRRRRLEMEAVITRVVVNEGAESDWEAVMRDRMAAAEASPGWIGGSILVPEDETGARVILGLWETRAAWEAWHEAPAFL